MDCIRGGTWVTVFTSFSVVGGELGDFIGLGGELGLPSLRHSASLEGGFRNLRCWCNITGEELGTTGPEGGDVPACGELRGSASQERGHN